MVKDISISKGYRQTEVGTIPEEWEVKLVEQISDVKSGKRLPLGKSLIDSETNHPYIRITDMFQGGVSLNEIKYVPDNVYPAIKNYRIFKSDIFISVAGTLGMVGKIPAELDGANLTENADRLTNIKCNREYLLYVMMSSLIQNTIESERTLGAQPKLALTRIRKFQIPLPSNKAEQAAIATALSDADRLITVLEKLIAKKRNLKQGAMQELLTGKKRLPGFSGKWEMKKLGEVANFYKGKGLAKGEMTVDGKYKCIHYGELFTAYNEVIKEVLNRTEKKDNCLLSQANDVLMPTSDVTPNGLATASCITENGVVLGGDILVIRASTDILDGVFLSYGVTQNKKQIMQLVSGSTVYHLYGSDMKKYEFFIPPTKTEQTAIAQVLSDMDTETDRLEQKLYKYKMIKQGMMQELLTGKTRLI